MDLSANSPGFSPHRWLQTVLSSVPTGLPGGALASHYHVCSSQRSIFFCSPTSIRTLPAAIANRDTWPLGTSVFLLSSTAKPPPFLSLECTHAADTLSPVTTLPLSLSKLQIMRAPFKKSLGLSIPTKVRTEHHILSLAHKT